MDASKILITDDDVGTCETLSDIFQEKGYSVVTTGTGGEAIDKASQTNFDVALIDIRLPDMEGVELIATLKEMQPDMVVIMITGHASIETALLALNEGASAYILKPLNMDEVLAAVKEALEKRRLLMENRRLYEEAQRELAERKRTEVQVLRKNAILDAINKVFLDALTCENYEEVALRCLAVAEELTGSSFGWIGEVNKAGLLDATAQSDTGWEACRIPRSDALVMIKDMEIRGIWSRVLKEEKSLIANDPFTHPDSIGIPEGHPPLISFLGVPLKHAGKTIGMIALANKEAGYDKSDQETIEALSIAFVEALMRKRAEKALRESEEKYRRLIQNMPIGLYRNTPGPEGKFIVANPAMARMFGYESVEEILQKSVADLYWNPADRQVFSEKLIARGSVVAEKVQLKKRDGTLIWGSVTANTIYNESGEIIHFDGLVENITSRVIAENALREAYDQLEQRVKERTAELVKANKELKAAQIAADDANRAKSDFLACMSHELRTPLNSIIGFSEVLRDKYFGNLNEKQADYVNDILESGKHLLSLINDILDLSKVEAGKMELELSPVNIKDLLENSLVMIKEKAHKHGINLKLNIPEELSGFMISADERKLKQVMFNLLSNAAKFTPDGGTICLASKRVPSSEFRVPGSKHHSTRNAQHATRNSQLATGDFIEISVADTGAGIATEDQQKIFEEFYQVRGDTIDKSPGTGLGLSLTKSLVEMHGGRIWVESEGRGKGSRFSFVLPTRPWQLEEGWPEAIKDRMASHEILLDHLNRVISLSKRHKRSFTLSCLHADLAPLKEKALDFKKVLEKEKRDYDFLGADKDGYFYFIFQETDSCKGNAAIERLKKKLEGVFEDVNISFSTAGFPEDGESPDALLRKVRK